MRYRPEIDGLRAVAVVPVILFHAGLGLFAGGFVGVDIFFVISGYLITSIILADLARGQFSILTFYERRARRILPALFTVLICCLPFAWMWMLPSQLKDFGQGLVAVSVFASNILFYRQSGYFEPAAEENPLLHTWSLAVEEQYYVVFPILLVLLWPLKARRVGLIIMGLAAISLVLSDWASRVHPSGNFYLAPTRAWELLAGSLCAFAQSSYGQKTHEGLAILGTGLIGISIFAFDETTPFPSFYALLPVGGTALIILFAAQGTLVAKALSLRPVLGLGLISYSAYLWHQPLLAFARIKAIFEPHPWVIALLVLASFSLAYLSWRFVEAPFRKKPAPLLDRRGVFTVSALALSALIGLGLAIHVKDGLPSRSVALLQKPLIDPARARDRSYALLRDTGQEETRLRDFLAQGSGARVLILGDSHSKDIFNAFVLNQDAYPDAVFLRRDLYVGCKVAARAISEDGNIYQTCPREFAARAPDIFARATHVILTGRWHKMERPLDIVSAYLSGLADMGKAVSVFSNTVEYAPEAPKLLRKVARDSGFSGAQTFPSNVSGQLFYNSVDPQIAAFNDSLKALVTTYPEVSYIEKSGFICDSGLEYCESVTDRGDAIYYDYGHWTLPGARYLGRRMLEQGLQPRF
ncbi:peptidoglycan/LPS O-acetylase OafA/YrhL [Litoreibacter meonggei]|uniref:Peptidoglycan/LPS O-acetylase OafA/YrhL n=1 Tax=Litoreibacter meonggei TaxID=1049199 RepID=A0A497VHP4_9RHOB|nr:acyltransferase family protein [Litoreibacter meonggei]RLJ36203.1 peptidoglycan/LPS O-acetylase OafA/YrhL [Litoreibacter meonggei]